MRFIVLLIEKLKSAIVNKHLESVCAARTYEILKRDIDEFNWEEKYTLVEICNRLEQEIINTYCVEEQDTNKRLAD